MGEDVDAKPDPEKLRRSKIKNIVKNTVKN
jgi:hypothetical protein